MSISNTSKRTFFFGNLAACLALWIPTSLAVARAGVPTPVFPLPLLTIVPALILTNVHLGKVLIFVPIAFMLWQPGLYSGAQQIPRRSYVLLSIAILLNALSCIVGWKFGVEYEGVQYTRAVCLIDALCAAVLSISFGLARKNRSFLLNLLLQWCLFAWLAWYAFPWLGELL